MLLGDVRPLLEDAERSFGPRFVTNCRHGYTGVVSPVIEVGLCEWLSRVVRPVSFLLVALLTAFVSAQASASSSGLGGNSGQGYGPQHPLAWTSSKTPENVSFILLPQNLSGLEQQGERGDAEWLSVG